jgi:hypothetical protein
VKHCKQMVSVRDTWRRTGRGEHGFEMHYRREQCGRFVKAEDEYCWQHRPAAEPAPAPAREGT